MPRIRSIHPEACTSERLALTSPEGERCYWRLQTHLDDEGRCEDHPRLIWAALFPLHETVGPADVDAWLTELDAHGLIVRYEVDGKRYLSVIQWGRFQHPQKPKPSKLPEPPDTSTRQVRDTPGTDLVVVAPGEGEGGGDGTGGGEEVAPAPRPRPRDDIWDAIVQCWNIDPAELTDTERGRLNKAAKLLRDVDASPDDIPRRRASYRIRYPDAADTPLAVIGRWSELRTENNGLLARMPRGSDAVQRAVAAAEGRTP